MLLHNNVRIAIRLSMLVIISILLLRLEASADDWPTYRHDVRRSAVSKDSLEFPLWLVWQRTSVHPPKPAFEDPLKHPTNVDFAFVGDYSEPVLLNFDHAYHPVAADGRVFFGSSADDSVRCLSLATGKQQWTFVTGGPVRFAPHVVDDRVFIASDDGFIYCLNAKDGDEIWTFRAAPSARQLTGNGRMISRWPLRSGVLALSDTVYATAGMWPAEGIFVYAIDADSGTERWVNDTSGTLNQPTANVGAYAITGVAPTGYLLANSEALVVPTGRSVPATYSPGDGRLLASTAPSYQNRRGGPAVCIDRHDNVIFGYPRERLTGSAYALHYAYQLPGMTPFGTIRADRIVTDDNAFVGVNDLIRCYEANSRYTKISVAWEQPCDSRKLRCLSLSANAVLMGVDDRVVARDRETGKLLWEKTDLDGYVQSIAVADERMLVSTDRGSTYCFANGGGVQQATRAGNTPAPVGDASNLPDMLAENSLRRGMALVVGEDDAELAAEIAATSKLQVVLLLEDRDAVVAARRNLLDTQTPGRGQVSVQQHITGQPLPFAAFSFNLIAVKGDVAKRQALELYRVLRPAGGEFHVREIDQAAAEDLESVLLRAAANDMPEGLSSATARSETQSTLQVLSRGDEQIVFRRGKLSGALDWDSENKTDHRVKWPLELLWFGGPGSKRTGGGSRAPIAAGGRNYVIGKNHLIALDAYNGTELWSRTLPYLYRNIGRLRNTPGPIQPWLTKSINADDDNVWLNFGQVVYTLDSETGEQRAVHGEFPNAPTRQLSETGLRFALDQYRKPDGRGTTSQLTGASKPAGAVEIYISKERLNVSLDLQPHVALDDHTYWELFFDLRPPARRRNLYEPGIFQLLVRPGQGDVEHGVGSRHPRVSISADESRRKIVLSFSIEELEQVRGGKLADFCFAAALNHLAGENQNVMAGDRRYLRWELHADAFATAFNNGWPRIVLENEPPVASASLPPLSALPERAVQSGRIGHVGKRAGSVVKVDGERANPLSQEVCYFDYNRGKGCGMPVSSNFLQVLRSGTLAFYDVDDDSGMRYFGGVRPSCTVSAVPAQGVVFAAEGSSGCSCNYNFKTSLALVPARQRRHEDWAMFTAPLSPGAQLQMGRFNLGAPGDRRDEDGGLWLQYPRAPTYSSRLLFGLSRTMPVPIELIGSELSTFRVNADRVEIVDTNRPWLYTSGYEGIEALRIKLFMSDKEGIVVFPADAPKLDANLEPDEWETRYSVPAGAGGTMSLAHDEGALFVAFEVVAPIDRRGRITPWKTREGREIPHTEKFEAAERADDLPVWEESSLEFLVSDASLEKILHFGVGVSGGRYDGAWSAKTKAEDSSIDFDWSGAVEVTKDKATAEFVLPWTTLKNAGLDPDRLVIRPRTRQPLVRQPHISHGFRPVILQNVQPRTKHYNVSLHFSELENVEVGERVFDIQIQGKTVRKSFDPVKVAAGTNKAIVQSFEDILADRVLEIRFLSHADSKRIIRPPSLSALEVHLTNYPD